MIQYQAKDLFQSQSELTDLKVDMAVTKAIDPLIKIVNDFRHEFKTEIHELRHEMRDGFSSLDRRVIAIETQLGMTGAKQKAWYERTLDFVFKTGWAWGSFILFYFISHFMPCLKV